MPISQEERKSYVRAWRQKHRVRLLEKQRLDCRNDPRHAMFASAKMRAKKRGIEFDIGLNDVEMPSDGKCPVLGLTLRGNLQRANANSPSIDRIDNRRGYVRGNVQVISWRANTLKNTATAEELLAIASYISRGLDRADSASYQRTITKRNWLWVSTPGGIQ